MQPTQDGFLITHISAIETPRNGEFAHLPFLTQSPEDAAKSAYRIGLDKNTLSADEVAKRVAKKQYLPLPSPYICEYGHGLWLDGKGNVHCGNFLNLIKGESTLVIEAEMLKQKIT